MVFGGPPGRGSPSGGPLDPQPRSILRGGGSAGHAGASDSVPSVGTRLLPPSCRPASRRHPGPGPSWAEGSGRRTARAPGRPSHGASGCSHVWPWQASSRLGLGGATRMTGQWHPPRAVLGRGGCRVCRWDPGFFWLVPRSLGGATRRVLTGRKHAGTPAKAEQAGRVRLGHRGRLTVHSPRFHSAPNLKSCSKASLPLPDGLLGPPGTPAMTL